MGGGAGDLVCPDGIEGNGVADGNGLTGSATGFFPGGVVGDACAGTLSVQVFDIRVLGIDVDGFIPNCRTHLQMQMCTGGTAGTAGGAQIGTRINLVALFRDASVSGFMWAY